MQRISSRCAQIVRSAVLGGMRGTQGGNQIDPRLDDPLRQRLVDGPLGGRQVLVEVLQVAAEIEDQEVGLVLTESVWVSFLLGSLSDQCWLG